MQTIFERNGKPFFVLGGQSHNSSAYTPEEISTFWKALEQIHGNTAEIPLYWEAVEPEEGRFDFSMVDHLIHAARERGVKLIFLWFATWKNGTMKYAPPWVKRDKDRFQRLITRDGHAVMVLSAYCEENLKADRRAFCAVMKHIQEIDALEKTVIAMQVENEPGNYARSYRDHSPEAEAAFHGQVPPELIQLLSEKTDSPVWRSWYQAGEKREGTWSEIFGRDAAEYFTAYGVARYIDQIAQAGKEVYPLPMLVNVWLDRNGWDLPGVHYPSGGAVPRVLDLWKWAAPHIDLIAPDIYKSDLPNYCRACDIYARPDNPLFVPESAPSGFTNALGVFYGVGRYHAVGYCIFGTESILTQEGSVREDSQEIVDSFHILSNVLPLLEKYHGTGRIFPIVQEEGATEQYIEFEGYRGLVSFKLPWVDFHHRDSKEIQRGRGLVIQTGPDEFYVAGTGFTLVIHRDDPDTNYAELVPDGSINFTVLEEGHFDADGQWLCDRKRSGDESDLGLWVYPDVGAVRVIFCD